MLHRFLLTIISSSAEGHFGVFFSFLSIWRTVSYTLDNIIFVLRLKSYMVMLSFAEDYFEFLRGSILDIFSLFSENGLTFFYEILYRCFCHYSENHKKMVLWYIAFTLKNHFCVFWGIFWYTFLLVLWNPNLDWDLLGITLIVAMQKTVISFLSVSDWDIFR